MAKQNLQRNINLGFRVTEAEREQIAARMQECGISNTRAFLLKMALNGYIIHLDLSEPRELSRNLRAVGNNLNQLARRANASGNIYAEDIADMQRRLDEVWEKLNGILKALAKI